MRISDWSSDVCSSDLGAEVRLSVGEYFFDNCFVQLYSMLRRLDEIEGIVMCSLFMLPADPAKRRWIYDRFLESGAALHCVFEGLVKIGRASCRERVCVSG